MKPTRTQSCENPYIVGGPMKKPFKRVVQLVPGCLVVLTACFPVPLPLQQAASSEQRAASSEQRAILLKIRVASSSSLQRWPLFFARRPTTVFMALSVTPLPIGGLLELRVTCSGAAPSTFVRVAPHNPEKHSGSWLAIFRPTEPSRSQNLPS
jgi:hypothetical protein